jgi:hypothetical protein
MTVESRIGRRSTLGAITRALNCSLSAAVVVSVAARSGKPIETGQPAVLMARPGPILQANVLDADASRRRRTKPWCNSR